MVKKIVQFVLFLGLGVTVMYLVFSDQNTKYLTACAEKAAKGIPCAQGTLTEKLLYDFSTVHVGWMLGVVAAFTLSNIFRALRWQMLLEPLGYRPRFSNSLLTILLGYFANLGFPRAGEVVRAGSLSRYERIPLEKVMGTLVVDRLMDFICLALVVGLAFLFEGETLWQFIALNRSSGASGGGFFQNPFVLSLLGAGLLATVVAFIFRQKLLALPIFQKILGILQGFWAGLRSVFQLRQPVLFLLYSGGIWLMFFLQCWFNLQAFEPTAHLTASQAIMVFVFGTLGMVIPSPGGMGTFHALAIEGLGMYGIPESDAFSYANIAFFSIQIFYNLVAGSLALILLPILNKGKGEK